MTNSSGIEARKDIAAAEARRFVTFAVTGGIAAVCNLVARFLMSRVMRYELAVLFSYLVGMIVAFVLARSYVFEKSATEWHAQLRRFTIVNVFAFAQVWLVSVGLVRLVFPWMAFHWHPEDVGHLIGVASPVFVSYYAHKHFSFRQTAGEKTLSRSDGEIVSEL
ncbi:MAG: GtrA family protein [Edaphobacter sp.]